MSNKNNTPNIDALHYDAHNFNAHTEQGRALLKKSVTDNGFGRSIVVDRDNNIIAGNGIVEAAKSLNKKNIRIIDTTGDELVVVRRTDIDIDIEEGRRLALADNATSAVNLAWNYVELEEARKAWNVKPEDWGVDMRVPEDNSDSRNITATERLSDLTFNDIYYTPSEIPNIKLRDCVNLDKYNAKIDAIREFPSAIHAERQKMSGNRLHHRINYRYICPKILRVYGVKGNIGWDTYPEDVPFTNEPRRRKL